MPWRVPLPGAGVWLRLRSGSRLRPGLEAPDLGPLLGALADAGVASAREALRHPFLVYAAARARRPRGLLSHPIFKFPGFSLLPTAVLFNAHQHIAYGGSLGQYYSEGLAAWLLTFAEYWAYVCTYLVLFASVCRASRRASHSSRRAPDRRSPRGCVGPSRSSAGSSTTPAFPRSWRPVSCSDLLRYGVGGLKTESAQPIRS